MLTAALETGAWGGGSGISPPPASAPCAADRAMADHVTTRFNAAAETMQHLPDAPAPPADLATATKATDAEIAAYLTMVRDGCVTAAAAGVKLGDLSQSMDGTPCDEGYNKIRQP